MDLSLRWKETYDIVMLIYFIKYLLRVLKFIKFRWEKGKVREQQ